MLPLEVVLFHVLPKCDIDTRLAFGIMPNRIDVSGYERGALGKALRYRLSKQAYGIGPIGTLSLRVPLWHVCGGTEYARTYIRIIYIFDQWWFRETRYNREEFRDCMVIKVCKRDQRFGPLDPRFSPYATSVFAIDSLGFNV